MKTLVVITVVLLLLAEIVWANHDIHFKPEAPCSAKGGVCVLSSECQDSTHEKGLCPKQQSQGAECCDRIPTSDRRCGSHGGECIADCPQTITHSDLECPTGKHCCIWLD